MSKNPFYSLFEKIITPKKLWILRFYVASLTLIVEVLLATYVVISIYNLISADNVFGDLILGYAGLYLVWICLAILFLAQVVSLFINVHDNIEDVRNKAVDADFTIDTKSEKENRKDASLRSFSMIISIVLAIILSFVNLNRSNNFSQYYKNNNTSELNQNESELELNNILVFTNKEGFQIEVYPRDIENLIYDDLYTKINDLGDGWRLPSSYELEEIYKQLYINNKGNFSGGVYWSDDAGAQAAILFDFSRGEETTTHEYERGILRPVRIYKSN